MIDGVWVIADRHTVLGFRLAGVGGDVAEDDAAMERALEAVLDREDLALVYVQPRPTLLSRLQALEIESSRPLVITLPEGDGGPSLRGQVEAALGVSLEERG